MEPPPWLSDLLELAELLLELGQRDDIEPTLERIEAGEISVREALAALRLLH